MPQPLREADGRTAGAAVAVLATLLLAVPADAQIYTRRNAKGVVEATNIPATKGYRLTYPGKGTLIHSTEYKMRRSYNGEFDQHIAAATAAYNVDLEFVRAIIQIESDFDSLARSSKGAMGLMQLMPATAARFGVSDPWNPRQNIFGGVQYLRILLDMFGGDVVLAAAAYNAGENAVIRYNGVPPYRETRGYVAKIQGLLGRAAMSLASISSYVPGPALLLNKQNATVPPPPPLAYLAARRKTPAPAHAAAAPPKPQVFYRWTDAEGVVHVGQNPPASGTTYTTVGGATRD